MNKTTRILLGSFALLFLIHAVLSVTFACHVSNMEADIRRGEVQDVIYLRALIRDNQDRIEMLEDRSNVTGGTVSPPPDLPCCGCDHVTVIPPESQPTEAAYTIRPYRDLVGVFDQNNQLIRVINVYRDTLSESDRAALEKGISVSSMDDLLLILDAYA